LLATIEKYFKIRTLLSILISNVNVAFMLDLTIKLQVTKPKFRLFLSETLKFQHQFKNSKI